MNFYRQEPSHSFFTLGLPAQAASQKCEKWVETHWPISLDKEKNKLDSYLRANACVVFLPGCELSEDMSLSSKTIKRNTDYTNPP